MYKELISAITGFIKNSPTAFHAIANLKEALEAEGFEELQEAKQWKIEPGKNYYVTRNMSSIIAIRVGTQLDNYGFHVVASHSDSPSFKIKENAEIEGKKYMKLNTEGYGGMLCAPWMDRPLSIAGRVVVKDNDKLTTKLLCIDRDLLLIPNVAVHFNRDANNGVSYNKQVDMLPLIGGSECKEGDLKKLIAKELQVKEEDIYGCDLFLYNRMQPSVWGMNEEFVSCPQLDDLQCAYTSLQGFLKGQNAQNINVFACFDNEEVGSGTKQGADSTFLSDVLTRVNKGLGKTEEDYLRALANSFLLSCDNAHAVHPNHPEKTDDNNCVYMNAGIVVKSHAGQKYTSDAASIAVFREICKRADVPIQFFANRSDASGGSTLGNISMAHASMNAVDIGLPQLAMHSSYETAGVKDSYYMVKATEEFFNSHIEAADAQTWVITK